MDRWDVLALAGVVMIGAGLWLVAPWLGLAVPGVLVLAAAVLGSGAAERDARTRELIEVKGRG